MHIDGSNGVLGREAELEQLRSLLIGARNGVGGSLLIEGDPGIGKTALIDAALEEHDSLRILRLQGVEVEEAFPYGALQRLERPLTEFTDVIPAPQRKALRVAVGLEAGEPPQSALVGLSALSMLAASADDHTTVWFVDDAQDIDEESMLVLGFAARRIAAERAVIIFASRQSGRVNKLLAGVPRLALGGLDPYTASVMLRRSVAGELDPTVVSAFVSYTAGNPLALLDLAEEWTADELTSSAFARSPMPIGHRLQEIYAQRLEELPLTTRSWLVLAAAESTGDLATVNAAATALGISPEAWAAAESVDFVTVRDAVRFRHPLIRSAAYAHGTEADRRAAHRALRAEARIRGRIDLAAWHAAAATVEPDAEVADEVAAAADAAAARGGRISQAHLLARAAELSLDPIVRSERYVAASEAAISAGAGRLASQMLSKVDVDHLDAIGRGRKLLVEAECGIYFADPIGLRESVAKLIQASDEFMPDAPELAQHALLLALNAYGATEDRAANVTLEQLGHRMRTASTGTDLNALTLQAISSLILDPYEAAVPLLKEAIEVLEREHDRYVTDFAIYAVVPCVALWDWETACRLLLRAVNMARRRGALREADAALWTLSAIELSRGAPRKSREYLTQAAELRDALGSAEHQAVNGAQLAWEGTPSAVAEEIAAATGEAGWGGIARMTLGAVAINEIAAGEYGRAFTRLTDLIRNPFLQASIHLLPDFIEAAVRSGNRAAARNACSDLESLATANRSQAAIGLLERARAIVADDDFAETHYLLSISALDTPGNECQRARTSLLYGEWLRRARRRREAAAALESALDGFITVGAASFAERARRELKACGATVKPETDRQDGLTSQEHEIARLAAAGATNTEIGAALFISTNTVDYHLRKVFRKLSLTSRRQLRDRFSG